MNTEETKENQGPAPGSPVVGQANDDGNGEDAIPSPYNQALELATKLSDMDPDYSKHRNSAQLKAALTSSDAALKLIATEFLKQNAKVKRLQRSVLLTTKKLNTAEKSAKEHSERSGKLMEALVASSLACSALSSKPSTSGESEKVETSKPELDPEPTPELVPEPAPEPRSLFEHREYQEKVKSMDLNQLDLDSEADAMVPPDHAVIEDGATQYEVPMYLMGIIMGRQKITLNRLVNQTKTEIDPLSWVKDGNRVMGFKILGADDAIRHAIALMIQAVRNMNIDRAKKLLTGHLRSGAWKSKPKAGPSGGSKSSKLCDKFALGKCPNGDKCRYRHKKDSKK